MIRIEGPEGQSAKIVAESLPVWVAKGWREADAPKEAPAAPELNLVVSPKLRGSSASAQPSDVTAPGESKVEGDEPQSEHVAQDKE